MGTGKDRADLAPRHALCSRCGPSSKPSSMVLWIDFGAYLLNGTDMITPGIKHDKLRNSHIGFVFQNHNLMPQLGVLENILLPTYL